MANIKIPLRSRTPMWDLAKSRALEALESLESRVRRCLSFFSASQGIFPTEQVSHLC